MMQITSLRINGDTVEEFNFWLNTEHIVHVTQIYKLKVYSHFVFDITCVGGTTYEARFKDENSAKIQHNLIVSAIH